MKTLATNQLQAVSGGNPIPIIAAMVVRAAIKKLTKKAAKAAGGAAAGGFSGKAVEDALDGDD